MHSSDDEQAATLLLMDCDRRENTRQEALLTEDAEETIHRTLRLLYLLPLPSLETEDHAAGQWAMLPLQMLMHPALMHNRPKCDALRKLVRPLACPVAACRVSDPGHPTRICEIPSMSVATGRAFLSIPGPTNVPDRVLQAMMQPAVEIYTGREFKAALQVWAAAASDGALRELTRDRVKRFIAVHLDDPHLTLDRVAAAIGCSKRYLHKLFDGESDTLNAYIWQRRLERIRQDLADPALAEHSITEIAFGRGFSSSTHFSRSFRARFGCAPREARAPFRA